jgi:hypothetical protein
MAEVAIYLKDVPLLEAPTLDDKLMASQVNSTSAAAMTPRQILSLASQMEGGAGTGGTAGPAVVKNDIVVTGTTSGSYTSGMIVTAGTTLEAVLKNMLQVTIPATYSGPSLSISGGTTTGEVGTVVTPTISPSWTQRDAGALTLYQIKRNNVVIYTGPATTAFTDVSFSLGTTMQYQATATYAEGPIKNNNQGVASPAGHILAGVVSSGVISYSGTMNMYYTTDAAATTPNTSAAVRALSNVSVNPTNGLTFNVNIPAGARRVVIAYPDSLRDLTTVKYVELGNGIVTDTFIKTIVPVIMPNNYSTVNYKVFTYISGVPFGGTATYVVTI